MAAPNPLPPTTPTKARRRTAASNSWGGDEDDISGDVSLGLAAGVAVAGFRDGLDRRGSARSGRFQAGFALAVGAGGIAGDRRPHPRDPRPAGLLARSWPPDVCIVSGRLRAGIVAARLGSVPSGAGALSFHEAATACIHKSGDGISGHMSALAPQAEVSAVFGHIISSRLSSQLRQQFGFALGGEAGAELALTLVGPRAEPGQGVDRSERQRAVGEALGDSAAEVAAVEAEGFALAGNPHWHVAPGGDIVRVQNVGRCADESRIDLDTLRDPGQTLAHRDRATGTRGIEHAGGPLLGHPDGPFGEVADVDELHRGTPVARG